MAETNEYSVNDVLANLVDDNQPFRPQYLHFFSDITPDNLDAVKRLWPEVSKNRKLNLLSDLEKLMEVDTLVSFDDLGYFALDDIDPLVKSQAIKLLWECTDQKLANRFITFIKEEKNVDVLAAAASGLGKFVLLGELEEIPLDLANSIKSLLIETFLTSEHTVLKQRVLESLGYANNAQITGFIKKAILNPQKEWVISALFAISRSANEIWAKEIIQKLSDVDPDIQLEAVKAAGELEVGSAKDLIFEIIDNSDPEEDIHLQAIWALSMIGGNDVRKLFDKMLDSNDSEEEAEMLEMALDNLELTAEFDEFDMFEEDE